MSDQSKANNRLLPAALAKQSKAFLVKSHRRLARVGGLILDQIYPPVCVVCDAHVEMSHSLCAGCWGQLRPITAPFCPRLGLPFENDLGPDALSAQAIADPPPFVRARSALVYNKIARTLISRLKFGDRTELARFCARLMVHGGADILADRPLLVPVPLHPRRQWSRRYNQSALLARSMAELTGLDFDPGLIKRVRSTKQQVGLSALQRQSNVAGAFEAVENCLMRVKSRRVVLIDDVMTTGATVVAVTRALHKIGVDHVDVISFARVVIGIDDII